MQFSMHDVIAEPEVIDLYKADHRSSAEKPKELMAALRNSHSLVTARKSGKLIGIGNAISDGYLVVYFPHMLGSYVSRPGGRQKDDGCNALRPVRLLQVVKAAPSK